MIHRRESFTRLAHRAAMRAQAIERLRRGHFMHQMAVDVEQRRFVWRFIHHVSVKQLLI